jgi:hypothetical protein
VSETEWVLPNLPDIYSSYPPVRYVPAYDKTSPVTIGWYKSSVQHRQSSSTNQAECELHQAR